MESGLAIASKPKHKYTMTISRLTVDKLGVKLYDRVSAVLAELVANSYDADAREVTISAPMGELLATKQKGVLQDKGYTLEVIDDGIGMTPEEVQQFYLKVGAERRNDPRRGAISRELGRRVMGRKGVGKLAPFGICHELEIITSGGEKIQGTSQDDTQIEGYKTAHIILKSRDILKDTDFDYPPEVGSLDETISPTRGTKLILRDFDHRHVPEIKVLERQLAQRFGIKGSTWKIKLIDSNKTPSDPLYSREVGEFSVETNQGTVFLFEHKDGVKRVLTPDGHIHRDLQAGIEYEGCFYPITGWVGYSKNPYKDELMAGIRIYCNNKIAAQTSIFNRKAGFTGEHDIRSYLVGELHADWLDSEEDLIQTDRRDILWSSELGQEFEKWGQRVVREVGKQSREPMKKKVWDIFKAKANLEDRIAKAFPRPDQLGIRKQALEFAQLFGERVREEELDNPEVIQEVVQLSLSFAPHIEFNEEMRRASDKSITALAAVTSILRSARTAELSSFGLIAERRVKVIDNVERLKNDDMTKEDALQRLLEEAPWLIDPQWSPVTSNKRLTTVRNELEAYLSKELGQDVVLTTFEFPTKRPDFVLMNVEGFLEIVEIKKPGHAFNDKDMDRLERYVTALQKFYKDPATELLRRGYPEWHITLVADNIMLSSIYQRAFDGVEDFVSRVTWGAFLAKTKRMHQDFIDEAGRQVREGPQPDSKVKHE